MCLNGPGPDGRDDAMVIWDQKDEIADLRRQLTRLRDENARLIAMAKERAIRVDGNAAMPDGCAIIGFIFIEAGGTLLWPQTPPALIYSLTLKGAIAGEAVPDEAQIVEAKPQ